jgi:hypothetical protein
LTGTTLTILEGTAGDNSNLTMSLAAGIFSFTDTTLTFNPATGNNSDNVMYSNGNKTMTVATGNVRSRILPSTWERGWTS